MGCLEVINRGYGFEYNYVFEEFKEFHWSNVFPEDLSEYAIPDGLEDWQKACYIGSTASYVSYYGNSGADIDFSTDDDCYKIERYLHAALGVCFEKMYGFPKDSIRSLSDYNGDNMFFLCVTWPPKEYNEALANLTHDSFLEKINEFISKLYKKDKTKTYIHGLKMCEEYDKW